MRTSLRLTALSAALALGAGGLVTTATGAPAALKPGPTPGIACAKGSLPETTQGRAPLADVATGRYAKGYTCNVAEISHHMGSGGYRVERFVDTAGHECAFWDSTLLWPTNVPDQGTNGPGTYVMDMADPAKPVITAILRSPAMQSPHESLRLNHKRGLLAANFAYPTFQPGFVDIYDVKTDCRSPRLLTSAPTGVLGHEGGFSPDGLTYWVASLYGHTLVALDLTDPRVPTPVFFSDDYQPHGVSLSDDGKTLYMAEGQYDGTPGFKGLTILDVSQVQARVADPSVPVVSRLTWPEVGTPQNATPFTRGGKPYLLEIDEFGKGDGIGAGRIIDIADPKKPFVVSRLRLAVNEAKAQGADLEADPGNDQPFQGYQGHYCSLPSRVDPTVIACTFIMSGLRVFDISDLKSPKEIAYHSRPVLPGSSAHRSSRAGSFAMSAPAYDQATGDIWYSDGNSGFYVVRLTGPAKRKSFSGPVVNPGN